MMRILVLGGTVFVGRHFVEAALTSGHEVVLFHRGKRGKDLFPQCRHIFGDRDGQIENLGDQQYDAVVDCCGYAPRVVGQSAEYLKDNTSRYLFVSTISVYRDSATPGQDESAPVGTIEDPTVEEITGETYGPLKALCEDAVRDIYGSRATIVRPGLIIGPYDPTNRFPYWVEQFATRDRVLVADRPEQPMQLIDARDLAKLILRLVENNQDGTLNAVGPAEPSTLKDMIAACNALNSKAISVWAPESELTNREIALWQDLPLILPLDGSSDGMQQMSNAKAVSAGLELRPWSTSAADVWAWLQHEPADRPKPYGAKDIEA